MNFGWKQLQQMKPSHYRPADKWVFRVVVMCGVVAAFLPWGGA